MPTPKTIRVEPVSEIDRLLDEADHSPVELEKRGVRYRVTRVVTPVDPDDIWAGYDPQRALRILQSAAGGWMGLIDTEAFTAYIAERRRTANRPPIKS